MCTANIRHCVKLTLIASCFVQLVHNAPRNSKQEPWSLPHCASQTYINRRLQSLEEVGSKELGAPYTCQFLLETGQIVLTSETESMSLAPATKPTPWGKTICAVWRFRTLHLQYGGPIPHTVASNKRNVAGRLRHPTAVSFTGRSSPRSGRRERHHHLRCSMQSNLGGGVVELGGAVKFKGVGQMKGGQSNEGG